MRRCFERFALCSGLLVKKDALLQRVKVKGPIVDDCNDEEDSTKNVVPLRLSRIFARRDVIERCKVRQELHEEVAYQNDLDVLLAIPVVHLDYVDQDDSRCENFTDHFNRPHKQCTVAVLLQSVVHMYSSKYPRKSDQQLQCKGKYFRIRDVVKDVAY